MRVVSTGLGVFHNSDNPVEYVSAIGGDGDRLVIMYKPAQ